MPTPVYLVCPACQTNNFTTARVCVSCGELLAAIRARLFLDQAEADIPSGQYDHARKVLLFADQEMLAIAPAERARLLLTARAFSLQGLIYFYKGHTAEADAEFKLALSSLEGQPGAEELLAGVLNSLGNVEFYRNHADLAAQYYQRSSDVATSIAAYSMAARAMGNLGIIKASTGRVAEADRCYTTALAYAESAREPLRLGDTYRLLAGHYANTGPYMLALEYAERALALREQIADQGAVCRITRDAAQVYLRYRDLERAENYAREAEAMAERTGYKLMQVSSMLVLAELMRVRDERDGWFEYASRAWGESSIAASQRPGAALQLIRYHCSSEDLTRARKYVGYLEEVGGENAPAQDQLNLRRARALMSWASSEWDAAEQHFVAALELVRILGNKYELAEIQEERATMLGAWAVVGKDADLHAKAHSALMEAVTAFGELGLPQRPTEVEAELKGAGV